MQPLITVAIVAAAVAATGIGFLGNTIDLTMVQLLGVGETNLESPITKAKIDFVIGRDSGLIGHTTITRNVIEACLVMATDPDGFLEGEKIICKLTDDNNNVVAEGMTVLSADTTGTVTVPITMFAFPLSNDVTNIHDIILVVQGVAMTGP